MAANKIINLHIPELYAIVRGKVGKAVEFGLSWGITRLRGGFLLATVATDKSELHDSKFAVRAVEDHIESFGKAPRAYAYDRGGWSESNVEALRSLGVQDIGLAPRGRSAWLLREDEGAPGVGAGTSRGRDRNDKVRKVRVQQTERSLSEHDGCLRPAGRAGLQLIDTPSSFALSSSHPAGQEEKILPSAGCRRITHIAPATNQAREFASISRSFAHTW